MRRRSFLALPAAAAAVPKPIPPPAVSKLAPDHQRPKYHFMPPANWMNNPNGPIYWNGQYHLFFQYNPHDPSWTHMHWGHAVSPDMIHWRHLPIAISPSRGGPDKDGAFGGCVVSHGGVHSILYTGVKPEVQCLATSHNLVNWVKRRDPVIAGPPTGLVVTGFRDPCVWREQDTWYMGVGSGFTGVGGAVLLYKSSDLLDWEYLHPLAAGRADSEPKGESMTSTGETWDSPDFFALGDKHVLLVSTMGSAIGFSGTYKDLLFSPETENRLDYGAYYGSVSQLDQHGRRILWGWIPEERSVSAQKVSGWSGVLSLPRAVNLRPNGTLQLEPAQQTRLLRGRRQQFVNMFIPDGRPIPLPGVQGDALEIEAELDPGDSEECGLHVLSAIDGSEYMPILRSRSSNRLSIGIPQPWQRGNLTLAAGEHLRLRIFVDCSVIEVFANGVTCVTGRAYTARADSTSVSLYARGGSAKLRYLQVYELKAISEDRMTS